MKIVSLNKLLTNVAGQPLHEDNRELNYKTVFLAVLFSAGTNSSGKEKLIKNDLAEKIYASEDEITLNDSELEILRNLFLSHNNLPTRVVALSLKELGVN